MKRIASGIVLAALFSLAGCSSEPPPATPPSTPAVAPPPPAGSGVEVHAPGVDVKAGKDGVDVKAPGTDVEVEKKNP